MADSVSTAGVREGPLRGDCHLHARGQHPGNVRAQLRIRAGVRHSPHGGIPRGRLELVRRRQHGDLVVQGDRRREPTLGGRDALEFRHRTETPLLCCWDSLLVHCHRSESSSGRWFASPALRRFWRARLRPHRAIRTEVRQRPDNKHPRRHDAGQAHSDNLPTPRWTVSLRDEVQNAPAAFFEQQVDGKTAGRRVVIGSTRK